MELAAAGEDMKKLREIARAHIARCEAGDMQAIKELADRLVENVRNHRTAPSHWRRLQPAPGALTMHPLRAFVKT